MPLITIRTSLAKLPESNEFLKTVSKEISSLTGKPESYVMTLLETGIPMTFAGKTEPSCYVEVKSIGSISPKEMSKSICNTIESWTEIPSSRIYINFEDVEGQMWGFNGTTF